MKSLVVVIVAVFLVQFGTSAFVQDAEHELQELRDFTKKRVEEAFLQHSQMSSEVDAVAYSTKERGLEEIVKKTDKFQAKLKADKALTHRCRGSRDHIFELVKKQHSDELIKCVDTTGGSSVNVLSQQRMDLVNYVWNAVYDEEKHIIVCGRRHDCLDASIAHIKDKVDEVSHVVQDEVDISVHNKEVQIQAIKGCASRAIANVEHALSKIPTCNY